MAWITDDFDDIGDLLEELMRCSRSGVLMACRGQPDAGKELCTSLDRRLDPSTNYTDLLAEEQAVLKEFSTRTQEFLGVIERRYLENQLTDDRLAALSVLQHYGAPTRLLDWTSSPWVALYFAAVNDEKKDGAVWWFDRTAFATEVHSRWAKHGMEKFRKPRELGGEIDLNKTAFSTDGPAWITNLYYYLPFRRMEIQQGFFTVAGRLGLKHNALIAEVLTDPAPRIVVVRAKHKKQTLDFLRRMGIHAQSLDYPGADMVGQNLRRELELKFLKKP